jgi:hypothetical protein
MLRLQACDSAPPGGSEVALEIWEGSIEQFTTGDDHHVDAGRRGLQMPEDLPDQSFSPIPPDCVAQFPRGHDPQPGSGRGLGRQYERAKPRGDPVAGIEHPLELSPTPHALGLPERVRRHGASRADYDGEETVSRLRPLARRRFNTNRPFFVAIRVRKPCVFRRRRRVGWNVRFMMRNPS